MTISRETKYKAKKVWSVILWVVIPYILVKVPSVLLGHPEFAEYSGALNILIYVGKMMKKDPSLTEMKLEGV